MTSSCMQAAFTMASRITLSHPVPLCHTPSLVHVTTDIFALYCNIAQCNCNCFILWMSTFWNFTLHKCANFRPVEQLITEYWSTWLLLLMKTGVVLARHYCDVCLTLAVGYVKHQSLWMHLHKVWGKVHEGAAWFWIQNLWLFHSSADSELNASRNWV